MYKKIYKEIKKFDTIVLARHIGPDPDALGSQYALKELILNTFPNKDIRVVGVRPSKFAYMGKNDKVGDIKKEESLLIVTDTPDIKRIDCARPSEYKSVIKIDHHPFIDDFGGIELYDPKKSSACEMISDIVEETKLELNKRAAEFLFLGIAADTNRFMFEYTRPSTFRAVANLIEKTDINIDDLYEKLYNRPLKDIKFFGYLASNFTTTQSGLTYVKISLDTIKEYDVDTATAGNLISEFNFIEDINIWMTLSEDPVNKNIRCSIRSKGPKINKLAEKYGGGGHIYASGAKPKTWEEAQELIKELDELCTNYIKNKE